MTEERGTRQDQLRAATKRVLDHPARARWIAIGAFLSALQDVYVPNAVELIALLKRPEEDDDLAIELIQNMYRPDTRDRYVALITRSLHNYLASAMTLVDHSRRLLRDQPKDLIESFEKRRQQATSAPEITFFQDLRNFTLHRSLPGWAFKTKLPDSGADGKATGTVHLPADPLLEWDKWKSTSRAFLEASKPSLLVTPAVERHSSLMTRMNVWLFESLEQRNQSDMREVNRLVTERNAILMGSDVDEAAKITDRMTTLRSRPRRPGMSGEDYMNELFGPPGNVQPAPESE